MDAENDQRNNSDDDDDGDDVATNDAEEAMPNEQQRDTISSGRYGHSSNKKKSVTAADAEFLEMVDTTTSTASSANHRVVDLHKSNLLRLQMDELVKETILSVDPTDSTVAAAVPKWVSTMMANDYVQQVSKILQERISLSNIKVVDDDHPLSERESNKKKENPSSRSESCPFSFRSDKYHQWKRLSSNQKLKVQTKGCYAANIGFTKPSGNAQVLPTLELTVLIPTDGIMEPKDYMKNRYFDKRNAIIWNVAQQLASTKHASVVGSVYWRGTVDHPTLLLIPPTTEKASHAPKTKNKVKRAKLDDHGHPPQRQQQLRFRVELHFGMDNLDWIQPRIRLAPNRCNLGQKDGNTQSASSPSSHMYNYHLTQDASHCFVNDVKNHSRTLKEEYPHWNEVLVLAKIWCLQRGLLNCHDGLLMEHIALLILYLYRSKLAGPRMGATQVLTALFKLLAETDWLGEHNNREQKALSQSEQRNDNNLIRKAPTEGFQGWLDDTFQATGSKKQKRAVLVLPKDGKTMDQTISEAEMAQLYAKHTLESPLTPNDPKTLLELYQMSYTLGPVFLDPTMTLNYLGRVSPAYIRSLQREAKKGLDCMHLTSITIPFQVLFMTPVRFFHRFDAYMRIPLKDITSKSTSHFWNQQGDKNDLGSYESTARGLIRVLRAALGDRVTDLQLLSTGNGSIPQNNSGTDGVHDSDEIPCFPVHRSEEQQSVQGLPRKLCSPNGRDHLVLGVSLNPDTCFRTVDRGPPADNLEATQLFVELWGKEKAELRRFKDGAIVHAVVWDVNGKTDGDADNNPYFRFQNDDKVQGGIVERIIRHILERHFYRKDKVVTASFSLRNLLTTVDGVIPDDDTTVTFNPLVAHRWAMKAFEEFSTFLRKESLPSMPVPGSDKLRSRLGIPLQIDAVEALDPALRYAQLFPPVPHPLLGGSSLPGFHKASGVVSSSPIQIQIRFSSSSKWPTDLAAIGAAKTAMLVQLVNGIEQIQQQQSSSSVSSRRFATGASYVTSDYADICFKGYVFRVYVRADTELKFLREMVQPTDEAVTLLASLTKKHVVASKHHSILHAVYTSHPSSSTVTRVAQRWVASHLFSELIPFEAIELLVAHVYTNKNSPFDAPGSMVTGLMRLFRLLSSHDWEGEPLIVDPQGYLDDEDHMEIKKEFDAARGPQQNRGPAMFIVAPYDSAALIEVDDGAAQGKASSSIGGGLRHRISRWRPTYTLDQPERVVLSRARQLAERSYRFMEGILTGAGANMEACCSALFQESSQSFLSFSALLRVDSEIVLDHESSSSAESDLSVRRNEKLGVWQSSYTRSMYSRYLGPKALQIKLFKNLLEQREQSYAILLEWNPVDEMVHRIRHELGQFAVFWYNSHCPEVVAMLWRPNIFTPKSFSAISSEYSRPVVEAGWQKDTLVTLNVSDVMRELSSYTKDIVVNEKVFNRGMVIPSMAKNRPSKRKKPQINEDSEDENDKDSESFKEDRGKTRHPKENSKGSDSSSGDDDFDDDHDGNNGDDDKNSQGDGLGESDESSPDS
ncbi:hypothetical protein ACA910_020158 [Epithemia clementina (nom. ined.)]